jgi:hypothetical protein
MDEWFALLTERALRRGVHRSTREPESAIHAFIEAHNEDPMPFIWTKSADEIIAAVARHCGYVRARRHTREGEPAKPGAGARCRRVRGLA